MTIPKQLLEAKIMKQEAQYDWLKDEVHCLHEENYKLREENTHLGMLNADLEMYLKEHKARIDKAIEYIEQYKLHPRLRTQDSLSLQERKLVDILKGSDKE